MILRENNSEQGGMENQLQTYIFIIKDWLAAEAFWQKDWAINYYAFVVM